MAAGQHRRHHPRRHLEAPRPARAVRHHAVRRGVGLAPSLHLHLHQHRVRLRRPPRAAQVVDQRAVDYHVRLQLPPLHLRHERPRAVEVASTPAVAHQHAVVDEPRLAPLVLHVEHHLLRRGVFALPAQAVHQQREGDGVGLDSSPHHLLLQPRAGSQVAVFGGMPDEDVVGHHGRADPLLEHFVEQETRAGESLGRATALNEDVIGDSVGAEAERRGGLREKGSRLLEPAILDEGDEGGVERLDGRGGGGKLERGEVAEEIDGAVWEAIATEAADEGVEGGFLAGDTVSAEEGEERVDLQEEARLGEAVEEGGADGIGEQVGVSVLKAAEGGGGVSGGLELLEERDRRTYGRGWLPRPPAMLDT